MSEANEGGKPMETRRRCTAPARTTGERCGNRPIPGGTVCRFHGGGSPHVRKAAARRLAELVDPAIGTMATVMRKGKHDRDKLRAAESILDRAGVPRVSRVEGAMTLEESRQLLVERILELRAQAGTGAALALPEVIEAEAEVIEAEVIEAE